MKPTITLVVEGDSDVGVLKKVATYAGFSPGTIYGRKGKSRIDAQIRAYNYAAVRAPWLVVRDLDADDRCAGALARRLLPEPAPRMCFRIAVRSIEAWVMADHEMCSRFFELEPRSLPAQPDSLAHPKQRLLELARRSRSSAIKKGMLPRPDTTAVVGPDYTNLLTEFSAVWRPEVAAASSESLRRCLLALGRLPR
jgi:hypothetical protein